jgi:hypothetical protein
MSVVQRVSLKADEAYDWIQQQTGYPGATPDDEGLIDVNILPSLIYLHLIGIRAAGR